MDVDEESTCTPLINQTKKSLIQFIIKRYYCYREQIVTYSPKHTVYQQKIHARQIERAENCSVALTENGMEKVKLFLPVFIKKVSVTGNGKIAKKHL